MSRDGHVRFGCCYFAPCVLIIFCWFYVVISLSFRLSIMLQRFISVLLHDTLPVDLPGPITSELTTLWRYTNMFIAIIIIFLIFKYPR